MLASLHASRVAAVAKRKARVTGRDALLKRNARQWLISHGIPNPTREQVYAQVYGTSVEQAQAAGRRAERRAKLAKSRREGRERLKRQLLSMGIKLTD